MQFHDGTIPEEYRRYVGRKAACLVVLTILPAAALVVAVSLGAANVPIAAVIKCLLGLETTRQTEIIVWDIRLPQALASMVAGAGLAVAGAAMQSILRNPLGSPFTLGISHAAAFGAALAVMLPGAGAMPSNATGAVEVANPWLTSLAAFACSIAAAAVIVGIARRRGAAPEIMVLAGVALGAFFTAGTMLLQFFADDVQLAAMVFWTFGDAARAGWPEVGAMAAATLAVAGCFLANSWNYNAIDAGDETARGLGVKVERVRTAGMMLASLLTAVIISCLGIIGFVGLVVPHMVRRLIGADHRFLLPASCLGGALLLLAADTAARLLLAPHLLPVSILTAMMGAPVFLGLIIRRDRT